VKYYGKFLLHYLPCTVYFRSNKKRGWGQRQDKEFDAVKDLLKSSKGLVHFNSKLALILSCDASPCIVGAVLCHDMADGGKRPVALASYTLTTAEKKYSQLELDKEALTIIFGSKEIPPIPPWVTI